MIAGVGETPGATVGGHRPALAVTRDGYCCENRDTPRMVLSRLESAAAMAQISHDRRNRFFPSG